MRAFLTNAVFILATAQSAFALSTIPPSCEQTDGSRFEQFEANYQQFVSVHYFENDLVDNPRFLVLFCDLGRSLNAGRFTHYKHHIRLSRIVTKAVASEEKYSLKQIAKAARISGIPTVVRRINPDNCVCNNWGRGS